jgi:3-phenylpropionate/trans-cinnamate dioxygenase ferredoxin subunit
MTDWIDACAEDEMEPEDVLRVTHDGKLYALIRDADGGYWAVDGRCTHQNAPLDRGVVIDDVIECPVHNGRFDYRTGEPKGAPACVALATHKVKVEGGRVWLGVG